jgi:alpha-L-rhamnosidase
MVSEVTWAKGYFDSPYGRIVSNWKREDQKLTLEVTIPANTTATVYVPAKDAPTVTEGGNAIDRIERVTFLRMQNNVAVYAVESGSYRFQSALSEAVK